jgi:hypothetical protein
MTCYISALEAEGIHTFVSGNHFGSATQEIIAMGGYLVSVPAAQLDHAVTLTTELRLETSALTPARSLRRRIWMLAGLLSLVGVAQSYLYFRAIEGAGDWRYAIFGVLNVCTYPFPITSPGDYRSKSGKMMQLR